MLTETAASDKIHSAPKRLEIERILPAREVEKESMEGDKMERNVTR
jgi:hypothetical protein